MKFDFIIMSHQRSGSTLLVELLNSVPNILCMGEILLKKSVKDGFSEHGYLLQGRNITAKRVGEYLDIRARAAGSASFKSSRFKLMMQHLSFCVGGYSGYKKDITRSFLETHKPRVLLLSRRDIKKSALSAVIAQQTGQRCLSEHSTLIDLSKVSITLKQIKDTCKRYSQMYKRNKLYLTNLGIDYREVWYEDMTQEGIPNKEYLDSIVEWLGVKPPNHSYAAKSRPILTRERINKYPFSSKYNERARYGYNR